MLFMYSRRTITRHALLSLSFVLLYLLLNRPEVVLFSHIGFVAWYLGRSDWANWSWAVGTR